VVRLRSCRSLFGIERQSFSKVQGKRSVRVYVGVDQWRQAAEIVRRHARQPSRLRQHALEHESVDVHQADLEQMQREHRQLLFVEAIGADLTALAVEDEAVGAVPVLDDVQAIMNLTTQCFEM